jgi:hypothetical protein
MNKWGWKLAVSFVLCAMLMATCFAVANAQVSPAKPDHISVLLFYQKGCCGSCSDMEKYVGDALNQYYGNELKSGMISYQVLDPKKDAELAKKYNVKDWSLKLVVTRGGQESVVDVPEVWMYVGNKDATMSTVKNVIDKQLGR